MSMVLVALIFVSGWLLGLATFLAGSLWRGRVSSGLEKEISSLLSAGNDTPGSAANTGKIATPVRAGAAG